MSAYVGDFRTAKVVRKMFNTNAVAGESITIAVNGTISAYKDGGITQSTTGITFTEDFDGLTGVHLVAVDTSADGTFYSAGSDFEIVLSGATIDGKAINATLFSFSLENRSPLMPTTDGRKLDVSAGGEAGIDWANVGSPTTVVGLSGTTIKTATDVETDTADIQTRLPAALVSGRMDASVGAYQTGLTPLQPTVAGRTLDVTTTGEAGIDWANIGGPTTVVNLSGTTIKTATDVETDTADIQTRLPAALVGGRIDASVGAMAANTLTASALATDAVTEIATGLLDLTDGVETGRTVRQILRGAASALLGRASGLATTTAVYRDTNNTVNRITATVDADGNRSAVAYDLTTP